MMFFLLLFDIIHKTVTPAMKIVLSVLLLLFLCHFGAFAQCNYDLLVKEGRVFFEKEQYRAALKKFNAARTCDPTKSGEVDKEVDRVFTAIEAQRDIAKQERLKTENALKIAEEARQKVEIEKNKAIAALKLADEMRDSARSAKESEQRSIIFQEANELLHLGDDEFSEKNYKKATSLFERASGLLKTLDTNDSIIVIKIEILDEKAKHAKTIQDKQNRHIALIATGDSLVAKGWIHYADAYKIYHDAQNIGYDTAQCLKKINNIEQMINPNRKSLSKKIKRSDEYHHLLVVSANELWARGRKENSNRRFKTAFHWSGRNLDEIKDPTQRVEYVKFIKDSHKDDIVGWSLVGGLFGGLIAIVTVVVKIIDR